MVADKKGLATKLIPSEQDEADYEAEQSPASNGFSNKHINFFSVNVKSRDGVGRAFQQYRTLRAAARARACKKVLPGLGTTHWMSNKGTAQGRCDLETFGPIGH